MVYTVTWIVEFTRYEHEAFMEEIFLYVENVLSVWHYLMLLKLEDLAIVASLNHELVKTIREHNLFCLTANIHDEMLMMIRLVLSFLWLVIEHYVVFVFHIEFYQFFLDDNVASRVLLDMFKVILRMIPVKYMNLVERPTLHGNEHSWSRIFLRVILGEQL